MSTVRAHRRRALIFGGLTAAIVSALALYAGTGVAASQAKPKNTTPPKVTGTPEEGKDLSGDRGKWKNKPNDFNYFWMRCSKTGGSCSDISDAHALKYTLTSADVGNTIRFKVQAVNKDGSTFAASVPTAVIKKAATPTTTTTTTTPKPSPNGCPTGSGPDQVTGISQPARLLVDAQTSNPQTVSSGVQTLVVRYHVTSSCSGPVQGALVYATATPFNQFSVPPETPTGADGWAELHLQRLGGFPVSSKQQLIAMFVRARKPGENILGGISTRRLFSIRVNLHQ